MPAALRCSPAQRSNAADVLADYGSDDPPLLAQLLMDADAAQFAVLFPKIETHRPVALPRNGHSRKTSE